MSINSDNISEQKTASATIASSGTVSTEIYLAGYTITGVVTPSAMTGDSLSFQISADGTNFYPVYDVNNNLVTVTIATNAARVYAIEPALLAGATRMKIVSDATEAADRELTVLMTKAAN